MGYVYHTIQEFLTHTKAIVYLVMGATLILLPLYWRFINGRDDKKRTY